MTIDDLLGLATGGAPLDRQRDALRQLLNERGVSPESVGELMAYVRDGIVLTASEPGQPLSRLGGAGLQPAGEPWPLDPIGQPHSFIAAIELAEMPKLEPLPATGLLSIYWDFAFHEPAAMDFVAATRVFFIADGEEAQTEPAPSGAWEFEAVPLIGHAMPIAGEPEKVASKLQDAPDREVLLNAMNELAPELYENQLLGSPREIQGGIFAEIPYWFQHTLPETRQRFSDAERAGEGWILLAQIEGHRDIPNMMFGDGGSLYLVVPEADLRQQQFERVMGIMQCY